MIMPAYSHTFGHRIKVNSAEPQVSNTRLDIDRTSFYCENTTRFAMHIELQAIASAILSQGRRPVSMKGQGERLRGRARERERVIGIDEHGLDINNIAPNEI